VDSLYRDAVDWRELCKQATEDKDPRRFIEIITQLNEALDERRQKPREGGSCQESTDCSA
jgi:hypothetical protein